MEPVKYNFQAHIPTTEPMGATNSHLKFEFDRLRTFPIIWDDIAYEKLALAHEGMYFTGDPRGRPPLTVKCYFCNTTLDLSLPHTPMSNLHAASVPHCTPQSRLERGNVELEPCTNFSRERHRLVSFLSTSWTSPVDPNDLAKWGFHWTGSADTGRCNFCRLEVRGWEPQDQGESEHRRWNRNCPFIQGRDVGNVPLDHDSATAAAGNNPSGGAQMRTEDLGVTPKHPHYASKTTRLQTYPMWPLSFSQRPDVLVDAGFYYTGKGDRVVCYHCGGGLKDWGRGDDPWEEHANWFPHCSYLLLVKGRQFVQYITEQRRQQQQATTPSVNPTSQQATTPSVNPTSTLTSDVNFYSTQGDSMADDNRAVRACKVCFEKEIGIVFLPCGHMATCPDCAPQLTACVICRAKANAYVRAFLP